MTYRNQEQWEDLYRERGGYWSHDGNPLRPHALLTSGRHSNGFFNSRKVIPDDTLMIQAASDLLEKIEYEFPFFNLIQCVVGPATGATKLAEYLAWALSFKLGHKVDFASPTKLENGDARTMIFSDQDKKLVSDRMNFLCEDVISTGGTTMLTIDALEQLDARILAGVATLVNRSGISGIETSNFTAKIVALVTQPMPMWESTECQLCQVGSDAIPAKGQENWDRLHAKY